MKSLLLAGLLPFALSFTLHAQTNSAAPAPTAAKPYPVTAVVVSNKITFPVLLSKSSEPLMTNAVYSKTFGRKVIFTADLAVKSFDIEKLHPSVIAQLDLDTNKVIADQQALDKQNQQWAAQYQQQNQQYLATQAAELAKSQAAAQAASTNAASTKPQSTGKHSKRGTNPNQNPQTPPPSAN